MAEKHGSGCLKPLLIVLLIILLLAIGIPFLITFLAVGSPVSYPAPTLDARDKSTMANVITRLARSLVDKEGRVVETAVLNLSPDEVQTLVNAAIRSTNRNEVITSRSMKAGTLSRLCVVSAKSSRKASW